VIAWGGQAAIVGLAGIALFPTDSCFYRVIACKLNVWIVKFESSDDSRILEGVTARIHGLKTVVLGLLSI
jgi:hypothetical protein